MPKKRTRILTFIDWFLPGYKAGGPIRSLANLTEHLKEDIEFLIVTRNTDYCQSEPYEGIEPNVWLKKGEHQILYLSENELTATKIRMIVKETTADLVYVNGMYSWYFSILPIYYVRRYKKKAVVSVRGMLAKSALGIKSSKKKAFLEMVKVVRLYKNVKFHATSDFEKDDIYNQFGKESQIEILPNLPRKIGEDSFEKKTIKEKGVLRMISIARIAPEKNLSFILEVLQNVNSIVKFDIYGPVYNESYWNKCKTLIDNLPENISVQYHGALNESNILNTINRYDLLTLPSLGENFGHVIAEAFMTEVPVLISDQTPWLKLSDENVGWDLNLQDKEEWKTVIESITELEEIDFIEMRTRIKKFINSKLDIVFFVKQYIEMFEKFK